MQITFERMGGFAGIKIPTVIDTSNLPTPEVNKLNLLLDAADFFRLPRNIASPTRPADSFQYRITVENGNKQHSVLVSEEAVPGKVKPLLDWLKTSVSELQ